MASVRRNASFQDCQCRLLGNDVFPQSCRALRVLQLADLILAEDTRRSSKLLSYFGIKTPMISFHLHNEQTREAEVVQKLRAGKVVAVVSDAGVFIRL